MAIEYYFIRAKEKFDIFNILMVVSQLQEISLDENGNLKSVSTNYSFSEEFPLDNIPNVIRDLEEVKAKITTEEFDHLCNLYENDIKKFLYHNLDKEDI